MSKILESYVGNQGQIIRVVSRDDEEGPFTIEITSGISGYRIVGVTREQLSHLGIRLIYHFPTVARIVGENE